MARPPAPPQVRTADASDWNGFVDRRGVFMATSLMVVILALTATRLHTNELGRSMAGPQLLLLLIVVGCVGVLAYRNDPA